MISGNTADFAGGAISLRVGVNAIIEDNDISGNTAPYGGGIHIETEGSYPRIISNRINSNIAPLSGAYSGSGHGGGISIYNKSRPLIADNVISDNRSSHGGAGIVIAENAQATINRNMIRSNVVADTNATYEGGGIYIANASASIFNNVLIANQAVVGGGIAQLTGSNTNIFHNTIVKNKASHSLGGGGIFVANGSQIIGSTVNNIFTENEKYQIFEDTSKTRIENNVVTNSGSGLYYRYGIAGVTSANALNSSAQINAANNVDGNPLFTDATNNDYHITALSSAVSVGASLSSPTDDIDQIIRSQPDAGAYEYQNGNLSKKTTVNRFWSDSYRSHFYTIGKSEAYNLMYQSHPREWRYEATAYDAFNTQVSNTVPLHRFWSETYRGHFYTIDEDEKTYVQNNNPTSIWRYEGIAYYVYPLSMTGNITSVDRFWSPVFRHHFYTADSAESSSVQATPGQAQWAYENERFKVPY